jgi:hypothetical protein
VEFKVTGKPATSTLRRVGFAGGQERQAKNLRNVVLRPPPRDRTKSSVVADRRAAGDAVSGQAGGGRRETRSAGGRAVIAEGHGRCVGKRRVTQLAGRYVAADTDRRWRLEVLV